MFFFWLFEFFFALPKGQRSYMIRDPNVCTFLKVCCLIMASVDFFCLWFKGHGCKWAIKSFVFSLSLWPGIFIWMKHKKKHENNLSVCWGVHVCVCVWPKFMNLNSKIIELVNCSMNENSHHSQIVQIYYSAQFCLFLLVNVFQNTHTHNALPLPVLH